MCSLFYTGIDLVGPLRESQGYKYIAMAVCYFSKYVEVKPLRTKTSDEVALFLYELICQYGSFESCLSDQGEFCLWILNVKFEIYKYIVQQKWIYIELDI